MIKVFSPFYYNISSRTIPGISVPAHPFQYMRCWLLLSARAHNGFGDMGVVRVTIKMDVDRFIFTQHPSALHENSRQPIDMSSIATPDQGRN
jgi:hypothetical protein